MNENAVREFLLEIKPSFLPGGTIELVTLDNNEIKLRTSELPQDMFKVQGKLINSADEIKRKIAEKVEEKFPDNKVIFV